MEAAGKVNVIRPAKPVQVDRIEKDTHKLKTFYEEGYECAEKILSKMVKIRKDVCKVFA